ncbi:hypothetical protein [Streptomyces antimicrobicus]|uniref:Lipoprotein n=1 Tax=Streptomyces antimicrobicus TaxID=2883108 RepID=A0ABS8B4D7_9ACTN|nr:hypothetical protein [Streptomyces antimicrobicus]MCB5179474.1 hypothetical protein [Streptomyces antimicrobicus]
MGVVALALGGALLTAGCGIKPTGVIESGQPAEVSVAMASYATQVYFLSPTGGLVPVPESGYPPAAPSDVLRRLLRGPRESERAAGLRTEVPALPDSKESGPSWRVEQNGDGEMTVRLPFPVRPLSAGAQRQLVCTAAGTAGAAPTTVEVTLFGPDGGLPAAHCPALG